MRAVCSDPYLGQQVVARYEHHIPDEAMRPTQGTSRVYDDIYGGKSPKRTINAPDNSPTTLVDESTDPLRVP